MTAGRIETRGIGRLLLVALVMSTFSCASLARLPEDTPDERRSKNVRRVFVGIGTFGISESVIHGKQRRILAARERYQDGVARTRDLAQSRTLDELIRLFAGDPSCKEAGETTQTCTWHFDTRVYGVRGSGYYGHHYSTWSSRPVQIAGEVFVAICTVPRDGSAREPGSCSHSTPDGLQPEGYLLACHARHPVYCPPGSWSGH